MARPLRTFDEFDVDRIKCAYDHLSNAIDLLRDARATKAANRVAQSKKSVLGALNHCRRIRWRKLDKEGKL